MSLSEILDYLVMHRLMTPAAADDIINQVLKGDDE